MKFERENPNCTFSIPDRPTVRQQLMYFSAAAAGVGQDALIRYWMAAKAIISEWDCELAPDLDKIDIDAMDDPKLTDVLIWVGTQVWVKMNQLDELPKN